MINQRTRIGVLIIFFIMLTTFLASCGLGGKAAANETWTLVELMSQGQRTDIVTEVVEVRHCDFPENKTVSCSAGTSNDISLEITGEAHAVVFSVGAQVGSQLGFGRDSGESLELETPPLGNVYRYSVEKVFPIIVGEVLAKSTANNEQIIDYAYFASCAMRLTEREEFSCDTAASIPIPAPRTKSVSSLHQSASSTVLTIFNTKGTFHIGDEDGIEVMEPLVGKCYSAEFGIELPVKALQLSLETFGTEAQNYIRLNDHNVAVVPPQGVNSPNEWADAIIINVPTGNLQDGINSLEICSAKIELNPDFEGDIDDFQIRNMQILAEPGDE